MFIEKLKILLIIAILLLSKSVVAREFATLPEYEIYIDEKRVENQNSKYPILNYKGITYVPMTFKNMDSLGISVDWNEENRNLSLEKKNSSGDYEVYRGVASTKNEIAIPNFKIQVNGKRVNGEYPFILFRDITYVPLTWDIGVLELGLSYDFNGKYFKISSDSFETFKGINAETFATKDGIYYVKDGSLEFFNGRETFKLFELDGKSYEFMKSADLFFKYGKNVNESTEVLKLNGKNFEKIDVYFKDFAILKQYDKLYSFNSYDGERFGRVYCISDKKLIGEDLFYPEFYFDGENKYGVVKRNSENFVVKFNASEYEVLDKISNNFEKLSLYGKKIYYVVNEFLYSNGNKNVQRLYSFDLRTCENEVVLNYSNSSSTLDYFVSEKGIFYNSLDERHLFLNGKKVSDVKGEIYSCDEYMLFVETYEQKEKVRKTFVYDRAGELVATKDVAIEPRDVYFDGEYKFYNEMTGEFENLLY